MAADQLISIGRVVKTQGLNGAFRVYPHSHESANLDTLEEVIIAPSAGESFPVRILTCRRKGVLYILTVGGVDSIDRAQELVGAEVLARPECLASLDEGEFYWYELVGMEVVADDGERLGRVASLIATGANDVLQVIDGDREILLPNIPEVILQVDRENRKLTVHLLPGLR